MKKALFAIPFILLGLIIFRFSSAYTGEEAPYYHLMVLAVASLVSNIFVLYYHYTVPPHPKFLLLPRRKLSIRMHIISGSVELLCGIIAFFSADPTLFAIIMAIAAFVHVAASSYQTPIVFGAKAVMYPVYIFTIGMHLLSAINLIIDPTSTRWLLTTFLALNAYVWVRVFMFIFVQFGLFKETRYSVSIIAACMVIAPAVLGPAGNLYLAVFVGGYVVLYKLIYKPTPAEFGAFITENSRYSLIDEEVKALWKTAQLSETDMKAQENKSDVELAQAVFEQLDANNSGDLDQQEIATILLDWEAPQQMVDAFVSRIGADGKVDFDSFYRNVWQFGNVRSRLKRETVPMGNLSEQEKAEYIFNMLDLDQSGAIDYFELQLLLIEWGLPKHEVDAYMAQYDDGDKKISFNEFFTQMKPIWRYGYEAVLHVV